MIRDKQGAEAVNMRSCEVPQDIYGITAKYTETLLNKVLEDKQTFKGDHTGWVPSTEQELEMARLWSEVYGISRKVTKKPTMIVPYGGTKLTCADSIEEFMQKEDVILPAMDWNEVIHSEGLFTAEISSPNSQSDEFEGNNLMNSEIELVDVIDKPIMITLMTNNIGSETSYEILNGNGEVIKSVSNLNDNTQYYDTIPYNPGCYEIKIYDEGEDGLSYWYNTEAGGGSIGLRYVGGSFAKHFDSDFGSFICYQFIYADADYINTNLANGDYFSLYPNPANDVLTVEMNTVFSQKAEIRMYDMFGKELMRKSVNASENSIYELNISELPEGVYLLRVINGKLNQTKKFVVK
jgi:hypothetical protein